MKKIALSIFCLLSLTGYAQVRLGKSGLQKITIGQQIDSTHLVALFGVPAKYESYYDDECYQAEVTTYFYDGLTVLFVNKVLESFDVNSWEYIISIDDLYQVQIGDSYSAFISSIPQSEVDIRQLDEDRVKMYFKIKDSDVFSDDSLVLTCKQGKIVLISWFVPV